MITYTVERADKLYVVVAHTSVNGKHADCRNLPGRFATKEKAEAFVTWLKAN